ncbi:hypothetical protein DEIPH_ctg004orf0025 [Deinococcus phoenicis]|uniref:Uncharacterized protein n=1 Tax=Deinococcus phoenicis TaxID=1476583 RepID=A0A016QUH4_9DEIO|nr:hypothetical protein [Deinococcus phoenicis]EYB69522.1 hypothetical protein DEIPH_ctg004orf0025 [Deinococcus phoenicis]
MSERTDRQRERLTDQPFASIDRQGGRPLPIQDGAHVRNAAARIAQTSFETAAARQQAAAQNHGLELGADDAGVKAAHGQG